jgi:molybdate transport system ATP-binding protein
LFNPAPHHHIEVNLRVGALHLAVAFHLTAPWTLLFGPSGSGKSTILRAVSGFFPSAAVDFASAGKDSWIELQGKHHSTPPHLRLLAYAPQGAVLFRHLTVHENVAFALAVRRRPPTPIVEKALTLFDLNPLADRLPRDLSGGERQRVNLARAFAVPDPTLLLLDEPFTGIDRATRDQLIPRMQQHLAARNVPVLSVTHDVEEALLLNAEVLRLAAGTISTQGPARDVLAHERSSMLHTLSDH